MAHKSGKPGRAVESEFYNGPKYGRGRMRNNPGENETALLERMYQRILGELAMNRFDWTGFPDSVDLRFLEMTLHQWGLSVVFKDTGTSKRPGTDRIFAFRATPSGKRNMIDNPVSFTLTGPGMDQHFQGVQLGVGKCVPIWSNYFRMTDWDIITVYSKKLAQIDRTIEINLNSARRNKILVYDENTRLSAENINRMLNNGDATIPVKIDISQFISALDLGVDPKSIETLSVVRGRLWSEVMGLLGINNSNQDKKERLVASEVDGNNDQVENMRNVSLNARRQACEKMRLMFPEELGEVWVDYHTDLSATLPTIPGMEDDVSEVEDTPGLKAIAS